MPDYSLNWRASPELYKDEKGVNGGARPPEGCPAEAGALSASRLPLLDSARKRQRQQQINAVGLTIILVIIASSNLS